MEETPATESECLDIMLESCFDFGEVDVLPPFPPPESVYVPNLLVPPRLPPPPPPQNAIETALSFVGFCAVFQASLQPSVNPATWSSLPLISLSVVSQHLRPAGSHLFPGLDEPVFVCSAPSRPVTLAPAHMLLPPSMSAVTVRHSASLSSLDTSAPPGSDIAPPWPWTCGPFAALRPFHPCGCS